MVMVAMMKSGNVQLQQIGATKKNKFGNLNLAFIFCQNIIIPYYIDHCIFIFDSYNTGILAPFFCTTSLDFFF